MTEPINVLAGCLYDEQENRPTDITDAGGRSEGVVRGTIDLDAGVLELEPMAIWTASLHDSLVIIDSDRRYYEFVKSVKVTFEPLSTSSVENIESDGAKEVLRVEYFNSAGNVYRLPVPDVHYKAHHLQEPPSGNGKNLYPLRTI